VGRPRKKPDDKPTTERLLRAAEEEFALMGFASARLGDISARVGISRPSLLYHFKSKQELYEAVIRQCFLELGQFLANRMSSEDGFEPRFEALVAGFVSFVEAHEFFAKLVVRELLDGRGPGRMILLHSAVPVLDEIESFFRAEAGENLPSDLPMRSAILFVASDTLLRRASGELGRQLWGETGHAYALARRLFLAQPGRSR
jgi:AcrR family transcriptional regulator